jgi:hypothetical protein
LVNKKWIKYAQYCSSKKIFSGTFFSGIYSTYLYSISPTISWVYKRYTMQSVCNLPCFSSGCTFKFLLWYSNIRIT